MNTSNASASRPGGTGIKILLVDDHQLFRQGLAALLSQSDDFKVVGELDNGKELTRMLANTEPDIVLMDLHQTGIAGLDSVANIKRRLPQCKVMLLTTVKTQDYVHSALRAGVDGYVLKDASFDELGMALRCVARGKKYLSPDVSGQVVESFLHPEQAQNKASQMELLTNRERSLLQLIAEGRTNRGAAEFLCVSAKTVEKHRSSLMQKLGLSNATELALAAMALGLIERPQSITRLIGDICGGCESVGLKAPVSRNEPITFDRRIRAV
jgi:DNA-binding NarL/FixJ family response regulator